MLCRLIAFRTRVRTTYRLPFNENVLCTEIKIQTKHSCNPFSTVLRTSPLQCNAVCKKFNTSLVVIRFNIPGLAKGWWCRSFAGSWPSFEASWNMTSNLAKSSFNGWSNELDESEMNFSQTLFSRKSTSWGSMHNSTEQTAF